MALTLSAAVALSFSNQDVLVDRANEGVALSLAQSSLQEERTLAQKDFGLLVPTTTVQTIDGILFTTTVTIDPQSDYLTYKVSAAVSWAGRFLPHHVVINSYVANYEYAASANTCFVPSSADWSNAAIQHITNFASSLTSLDAFHNRLYVGATGGGPASSTLFLYDTSQPNNLRLLGSVDTTGPSVSSGVAALAVATTSTTGYVYVANSYGANFTTCKPQATSTTGGNCAELQIFDIQNPAAPVLMANYELPTTTALAHVTGTGSTAGNSIFYDNGYVYVGLTKATTGPEFNIIDVHDPRHPQWVGGYSVGYVVNAIYEKDNIAYVAHPTDSNAAIQEQVTVLDVSDKTNPTRIGGYKAPDKQGNGKSLFMVGDALYFGRTVNTTSANNDFYILNATSPNALQTNNPNSPQPWGKKVNSSVGALLVRNSLTFLLTGTSGTPGALDIFSTGNSAAISTTTSLVLPSSSSGTALDCEGNTLYVASNDPSGKGYLSVIYPHYANPK